MVKLWVRGMFQSYVDSILEGNDSKHAFSFYQQIIDDIVMKEFAINLYRSSTQQVLIEKLIDSETE